MAGSLPAGCRVAVRSEDGPVKIYAQNCLQAPADLKSAGNGDVVQSCLQVLHVHVFLVAPLGARHMTQPGADQHQGGVTVRKCPYHPRPSADLPVQPLDHIVGADARPVFAGEIAVGQRFLDAVLDLLGGLLQLHGAQLGDHSLCLLAGRLDRKSTRLNSSHVCSSRMPSSA